MGECRVSDIIEIMNSIAPESLAADFDNSGFQVGSRSAKVSGIAVALDCTDGVIDYALECGYNMIITHHPLIFGGLKSVTDDNPIGRLVQRLISNGISLYSAHTNYDRTDGGTDDILADLIGIGDRERLEEGEYGFGRIGRIGSVTAGELKKRLENALGSKVLSTAEQDRIIVNAASCAGAGGFLLGTAATKGADIYITGEAKYHDVLDAKRCGMDVILLSHQLSEQISLNSLKNALQNRINGVQYYISVQVAPIEPLWNTGD